MTLATIHGSGNLATVPVDLTILENPSISVPSGLLPVRSLAALALAAVDLRRLRSAPGRPEPAAPSTGTSS